MPEALGIVVFVAVIAAGVWLLVGTQSQLKQLRAELDQTQAQLNDTQQQVRDLQQQVNELKAEAIAPPPPQLPRNRSSGLDDLREQLRAAHLEDDSSPDE
jgi:septal ring factor EnvC (AmiA/AmiB activator)